MDATAASAPRAVNPPPAAATLPAAAAPERPRLAFDPERAKNGLVALVLAILELVRQLLLRQALRRMESGTLTEEQIERLGTAMMRLEETLQELKEHFGLTDEDINLDLGPLGKLL